MCRLPVVLTLIMLVRQAVQAIEANEETPQCPEQLKFSWMLNVPFTTNESAVFSSNSLEDILPKLLKDALLHCCNNSKQLKVKLKRAESEKEMLDQVKNSEAHIGYPMISSSSSSRKNGMKFVPLTDYPGATFLVTSVGVDSETLVLEAVFKSWPLLLITVLTTAIAGIVVWGLETCQNPDDFPRSFIKGAWEGVWWSFVSMTTVGYGDRVPKSVAGRLFGVVWIYFGLVIMAIFMANIITALTAASMDRTELTNKKVAVMGNGTEYEIARKQGAEPFVFSSAQEMVTATKEKQVDGILLNSYAAAYYMKKLSESSLFVALNVQGSLKVGLALADSGTERDWISKFFSCTRELDIGPKVESLTGMYKNTDELKKKPKQNTFNIFDSNSGTVYTLVYSLLGILAGLLIMGLLFEFVLMRNQNKTEQYKDSNTNGEVYRVRNIDKEVTTTITGQQDLKEARQMLQRLLSYLDKMDEEQGSKNTSL